ncbi:MAG: NADH-quinone oxidoreductase subunit NuoG [Chlamydiales bacterium]|nr:NADH-quinone oxidoreductase subunit NuoG [Chlamydiales bacterium]
MTITLTIDDQQITVPKGTTVYTAAKNMGIELPIFCYQDRMPPFGACRVCLVEVDKMPKLQTSCTLECTEGMVVRTQAHPAVKAREEILEFLLINHPLDCPICDKGGECPLQDQALEFGPDRSRFYEDKRHFEKPISLGPVLKLDRERCIVCARCTRFGDIVAGDHALEFIERGFKSEVGTADGGAPQSKFIGNTIAICPVGALTSDVYRFRARPWDNIATNSTCTLCPVGCSNIIDSRDGEVMRIRSQENRAVNDIWLCDKGWFGYEYTASLDRLTTPLIRQNGTLVPASWDDAFAYVANKMKEARSKNKIAAFGGNTLTVEENYLLQMLMRGACNTNNVDHRIGMPIIEAKDEGLSAGMEIEIGDCTKLTHVLLLGCDITEEFPVIWLRLKDAINKGCKVIFAGNYTLEVARYFEKTYLLAPNEEVSFLQEHAQEFKDHLMENSAIFVGSQFLATKNRKNVLAELLSWQTSTLNILEGSDNSVGARFAGMHPEFKPQGIKLDTPGKSAVAVLEEAASTGWDVLYAVGCDVATKVPSKLWEQARAKTGCLIVQDLFMTKTAECADVVLPTLSFIEKGGSFLNIEHRIQKLKPGKAIPKNIFADSYIFVRLAHKLNYQLVIDEPFLQKLKPGRMHHFRPKRIDDVQNSSVTKSLSATFAKALFDQGTRMQHNKHVKDLTKPAYIRIHPETAGKLNDEITLKANGHTITGPLMLDATVAKNTVVIPLGFKSLNAHELGQNLLNGLAVEFA